MLVTPAAGYSTYVFHQVTYTGIQPFQFIVANGVLLRRPAEGWSELRHALDAAALSVCVCVGDDGVFQYLRQLPC